ncbi:MAG: hypothetical protein ACR2HY_03265, partial [Acidimicrobiales bacterium]
MPLGRLRRPGRRALRLVGGAAGTLPVGAVLPGRLWQAAAERPALSRAQRVDRVAAPDPAPVLACWEEWWEDRWQAAGEHPALVPTGRSGRAYVGGQVGWWAQATERAPEWRPARESARWARGAAR